MNKTKKLFLLWITDIASCFLLIAGTVIFVYPVMNIFYPVSEIYPVLSVKAGIAVSVFLFLDGIFLISSSFLIKLRCRIKIYFIADPVRTAFSAVNSISFIKKLASLKIHYAVLSVVRGAVFYFPAAVSIYVILYLLVNEESLSRNIFFILLILSAMLLLTGRIFSLCLRPYKAYGEYLLISSPLQPVKDIVTDTVFLKKRSFREKLYAVFSLLWSRFLVRAGVFLPLLKQYGMLYSAKGAVNFYYRDK